MLYLSCLIKLFEKNFCKNFREKLLELKFFKIADFIFCFSQRKIECNLLLFYNCVFEIKYALFFRFLLK